MACLTERERERERERNRFFISERQRQRQRQLQLRRVVGEEGYLTQIRTTTGVSLAAVAAVKKTCRPRLQQQQQQLRQR